MLIRLNILRDPYRRMKKWYSFVWWNFLIDILFTPIMLLKSLKSSITQLDRFLIKNRNKIYFKTQNTLLPYYLVLQKLLLVEGHNKTTKKKTNTTRVHYIHSTRNATQQKSERNTEMQFILNSISILLCSTYFSVEMKWPWFITTLLLFLRFVNVVKTSQEFLIILGCNN